MADLSDFTDRDLLEAIYNNTLKGKSEVKASSDNNTCDTCGEPATVRSGTSQKNGKQWRAKFCSTEDRSHTTWL